MSWWGLTSTTKIDLCWKKTLFIPVDKTKFLCYTENNNYNNALNCNQWYNICWLLLQKYLRSVLHKKLLAVMRDVEPKPDHFLILQTAHIAQLIVLDSNFEVFIFKPRLQQTVPFVSSLRTMPFTSILSTT